MVRTCKFLASWNLCFFVASVAVVMWAPEVACVPPPTSCPTGPPSQGVAPHITLVVSIVVVVVVAVMCGGGSKRW